MPSTGTRKSSTAGSAGGASASYTEHGPPDRMIPSGFCARTCSMGAVQGSTTEKTFCSRMRRAISCVYCEPKSRMTIEEVSIGNQLQSGLISSLLCNRNLLGRIRNSRLKRPQQLNKCRQPRHLEKIRGDAVENRSHGPPRIERAAVHHRLKRQR